MVVRQPHIMVGFRCLGIMRVLTKDSPWSSGVADWQTIHQEKISPVKQTLHSLTHTGDWIETCSGQDALISDNENQLKQLWNRWMRALIGVNSYFSIRVNQSKLPWQQQHFVTQTVVVKGNKNRCKLSDTHWVLEGAYNLRHTYAWLFKVSMNLQIFFEEIMTWGRFGMCRQATVI